MSGHGYRTTTVEYYEYEMPDSRELSYEPMQPMQFPLEAGFWESYQPRPVNFQRYHQPELLDHPTLDNDHNEQNRELIYGLVPCHQRHTIIEYCEQEAEQLPSNDPMPNTSSFNEQDQHQANEYEAGNGDASATETDESRKNGKKKNIYRAEEGYLVEEPTSESEEDQEIKS